MFPLCISTHIQVGLLLLGLSAKRSSRDVKLTYLYLRARQQLLTNQKADKS